MKLNENNASRAGLASASGVSAAAVLGHYQFEQKPLSIYEAIFANRDIPIDSAQPPSAPVSEVQHQLGRLESELVELGYLVGILQERLVSLVVPAPTTTKPDRMVDGGEGGAGSPLGYAIQTMRHSMIYERDRLANLIDSLAV